MKLKKVISGAQTGADLAGLVVAKRFGLETGGMIPKGWKTLAGPRPEYGPLYGIVESTSPEYAPRTEYNVANSDGTIRLAGDFNSRGELCTLKAIKSHKKPYIDVDLSDPVPIKEFVNWLEYNNIATLNVAGNSEQTFLDTFRLSVEYLSSAFFQVGLEMSVSDDEILKALGLKNPNQKIIYTADRQIVDSLKIREIGRK